MKRPTEPPESSPSHSRRNRATASRSPCSRRCSASRRTPRHLQPSNQRQRLLSLLVEWFSAFAKDGPCCLIIEDWHWVDPSMRDFVQHLLDRPNEPPVLVLVTTRQTTSTLNGRASGVATPALARTGACELQLGGLPPAAARELVSMVCPGMPLPAGLVRLLVSRGDGVPLFLEEAARMALGARRATAPAPISTRWRPCRHRCMIC